MQVNFEHKGNFNKLERFLTRAFKFKPVIRTILNKYGRKGVEALREATPKDSGKTADSWIYEVVDDGNGNYEIVWSNTNVVNGWANVAILLQYGHATRNGRGRVSGDGHITEASDWAEREFIERVERTL